MSGYDRVGASKFTQISFLGNETLLAQDVAYAEVSESQKMDIYLPISSQETFPLVIYIHGGAFKFGDKANEPYLALFSYLLMAGYAVASLNYRMSGEATFPALIKDVKTAVRYLRAHAYEYRLDVGRFGAFGDSAGGYLVAMLGTTGSVEEFEGAELGYADQSSRVQAVVDWYGPTNFLEMDRQLLNDSPCGPNEFLHDAPDSPESELMGAPIQTIPELVAKANPANYATPDAPPFLIQHGTHDCTVPAKQSTLLYAALVKVVGAEQVRLELVPNAEHGDKLFFRLENMQRVIEFFDGKLKS
jgi:acetyl esterase/lipase